MMPARHDRSTWQEGAMPASRVGIAIHEDAVRIVGLRCSRADVQLCWAIEATLEENESMPSAVRELLLGAPLRRWPVPQAVVALSAPGAQVRRLEGLPDQDDAELIARIVGASPSRYFLRNGVPVLAGGVRLDADRTRWGTAFAAPLPVQLADAVHVAGAQLRALTPMPVALAAATHDCAERIVVRCDGYEQPIEARGRRFAGFVHTEEPPGALPTTFAPVLTALGDAAINFAAAYGAATLPADEPLVLQPPARRRSASLSAACAVAGIAIVLGGTLPLWRARQFESDAARALIAHGPALADAVRAEARVLAVDRALAEAAAFDVGRASRLALLDRLTAAIPEDAALTSLRVDSTEVTLTVVARRMATVTIALERADGLRGISLLGAVRREAAGLGSGAPELERATFRVRPAAGLR